MFFLTPTCNHAYCAKCAPVTDHILLLPETDHIGQAQPHQVLTPLPREARKLTVVRERPTSIRNPQPDAGMTSQPAHSRAVLD